MQAKGGSTMRSGQFRKLVSGMLLPFVVGAGLLGTASEAKAWVNVNVFTYTFKAVNNTGQNVNDICIAATGYSPCWPPITDPPTPRFAAPVFQGGVSLVAGWLTPAVSTSEPWLYACFGFPVNPAAPFVP